MTSPGAGSAGSRPSRDVASAGHDHAVVIGAGMAGLLAAHVLAERYKSVTLIDRDRMPESPQFRAGVPQSRHTHLLLGRGLESLETLLPGIVRELVDAGGVPIDWPGDALWLTPAGWCSRFRPGMSIVSASRDLIEWQVRQRVLSGTGITLLEGTEVTGLVRAEDSARVAGVTTRERGTKEQRLVRADLVLDASGRGSAAPDWLAELGWQVPQEIKAPSDVGYASRFYARPEQDQGWRLILLQTQPPEHTRSGMLLPVDGDRWMVSMVGVGGDHPPTDDEGFLAFAKSLRSPVLHDAISTARPLTPVHGFRVPDSRRRRYELLSDWPRGFAVVGDALCSLNPMYAQGMSVAAATALAMREELGRTSGEPLGKRLQKRAARSGSDAWLIASGEDVRYLPPAERGRRPFYEPVMHAYFDRVLKTGSVDRKVNAALLRVLNLQSGPYSLIHPAIAVRALLPRRGSVEAPAAAVGQS
jgi:2-polyprenyl-6-methoxyphenol hydroxylase-like FAD-dependent oxidoreductase